MKIYNRIFALICIVISGFAGGAVLIMNWRIMALGIVSLLTLLWGINFWRNSYQDINLGQDPLRAKLHPALFLPICALACGAALAGWLIKMI